MSDKPDIMMMSVVAFFFFGISSGQINQKCMALIRAKIFDKVR
jgi:hypothetical protein